MGTWKVILSNNAVVEEKPGHFGDWNKLKHRCDKEKLSIKKLFFDDKEWTPQIMAKAPEAIFIIQDGVVFLNGRLNSGADFRRGLGAISFEYNRYRIDWKDSSIESRNYSEVRKDIPGFYREICISYNPNS